MIDDWGLGIGDCMGVSPWAVVWLDVGGLDSRLRGNDGGGCGNDVGVCGDDVPRACAHEFSPHLAAFCWIVSIPVDGERGRIVDC